LKISINALSNFFSIRGAETLGKPTARQSSRRCQAHRTPNHSHSPESNTTTILQFTLIFLNL